MARKQPFRKADIEFHQLGYGYRVVPAVNVKVRGYVRDVRLPVEIGRSAAPVYNESGDIIGTTDMQIHYTDADFDLDWIEAHLTDADFEFACERGWELLQEYAEEIFGHGVKVYSEGRSGGWAYVEGIDHDVEHWDAITVSRWGRFVREAQAITENIPYDMVMGLYLNEWEAEREERVTRASDDADSAAEHDAESALAGSE